MKTFIALAIVAGLSACASGGSTTSTSTLLRAQTEYGRALAAAVAYESLPRCAADVSGPCSVPSAVSTIRERDKAAQEALQLAKHAVADGSISETDEALISEANRTVVAYTTTLEDFGIEVEDL